LESDNHTKVAFDLRKAGNFILELDGSHEFQTLASGLMIFADYKEAPRPSTLYFGPGVHILPSDNEFGGDPVMWLKNDTIVHIDAGAVVLGYIRANNARNITIRGRGILASSFLPGQAVPTNQLPPSCDYSNAWKRPYYHSSEAIRIENCSDVTLDGITIVHGISWNIAVYATNRTYVRGVKILSWRCMSDGMDFDSSENVLVEQCFIRSNDDAIAIKGEIPSFDSRNIMIRDNVLWGQTFGNCMEIGGELFNGAVENITFLRNVCFHAARASMAIHDCGHAAVRNILFQDNVVEAVSGQVKFDEDQGMQLIDLHIARGQRMLQKKQYGWFHREC
jgi:polygalacturonase